MKKKIKCIIKYVIAIILLIIPIVLINHESNCDIVQNASKRWDSTGKSAHISAFMSNSAEFTLNEVMAFEETIENSLKENDALDSKNGGSVWKDCYSADGNITITKDGINTDVKAIGVGGDFFIFHPLELIKGAYFGTANLMQDLVIIDEDTAWRLFGSVDVQGMTVKIGDMEHTISGVVKRDKGSLNKAAGNSKPTVYISYNSFTKFSDTKYITSYEVIMPNLTKDYAYKIVKKGLDLPKSKCEIVENSDRYSLEALIGVIRDYGKRSMKTNTVIYPYWENVARGREDRCAALLLMGIILLIIYLVYIIVKLIKIIKKNSTKIKNRCIDVISVIKEKIRKRHSVPETEIDTVIFDIGNVLVKFIPMQFLKKTGFDGEERDAVFAAVIENDIWNEYDKGIMTKEAAIKKFIDRTPELRDEIIKVFDDLNGIVKRFDYTDEWISELKNYGIRVLYLSNISETLYNDCIDELDFTDDMEGGILSFEAKCSKPDVEIYEKLIEKYNLNSKSCIFVDDRQSNLTMARKIGFNGILFTTYEETKQEILSKIL